MVLSCSPLHRLYGVKEGTTSIQVLCECKALALLRHVHLGLSFWTQRLLRVPVWWSSGTSVKEQGSLDIGLWGTKDPSKGLGLSGLKGLKPKPHTHKAPRILRWLLDFWKIFGALVYTYVLSPTPKAMQLQMVLHTHTHTHTHFKYGRLKDTTYLFAILSNINWHAVIKLMKFADCFKSLEIPTLFLTNRETKRKHRSSTRNVTCAHISYKYFFNGTEYTVINQCNKIHQSV